MALRHTGRELALKALYQIDTRGGFSNEDLALFFQSFAGERTDAFALRLVDGAWRERDVIDGILADALEHWSIGRLSRVDHNILRIGVYELLRISDIPARVTIDEAIELAKTFGDQDSGRFVNGVLDQVAGRLKLKDKGEERSHAKVHDA
ncbi:MAG: transcription antitermination factor NusB [Deltaproteobacteria bacterium]|nr:transcription antitermination factor NusB [Deltaproteobacteria bacterium]